MATQTITTQGQNKIETSLANTQVVQNPLSSTANNLQLAGNLALEGYRGYVLNDANRRSQEIVQQLDGTLQDIDDAQSLSDLSAVGASLSAQISDLASSDPRLANYAASMGSLNTAIQQRKGAKRLYELKAEAALRETVAKAPGLRSEITQIAARNLGFDPTSATINAILRGIDQEQVQGVEKNWYHEHMAKQLVSAGVAVTPEMALGGDTQALTTLYNQINTAQGNIDQINNQLASGETTVQNSISDIQTNLSSVINAQTTPLLNSVINNAMALSTEDEFLQFQTNLKTGAAGARQSIENNVRGFYSTIKTNSPEERRLLEEAATVTIANVNAMFDGILNQDNITSFQNRAKSLQFLRDSLGVDMITGNKFLAQLEQVSPGITSNLGVQVLAQNPMAYESLRGEISKSFDSLSSTDPKRRTLENSLKVLENYRAFSNVSEEDREAVIKNMPSFLDGYLQVYKSDPKLLSPQDYKAAGNAAATMMQLSSQFAGSDWDRVAKMGATPGFQHLIEQLQKGDDDSKQMASIVSASYNEAVLNTIKRTIPDGIKDMNLVLDLSKGEVVNKSTPGGKAGYSLDGRTDPVRIAKLAWHGDPHSFDKLAREKTAELNNYIQTVYDNRHLDPTIAELDKGQIAHLLTQSLRGTKGVSFVGNVTPYNLNQKEKDRRLSMSDAIDNTTRAFEDLSVLTQTGALSGQLDLQVQNFEQVQDTIRSLNKQLLAAQQRAEALKNANR